MKAQVSVGLLSLPEVPEENPSLALPLLEPAYTAVPGPFLHLQSQQRLVEASPVASPWL